MKTAGVTHKLQWAELAYRKQDGTWFRDYDVQDVLARCIGKIRRQKNRDY